LQVILRKSKKETKIFRQNRSRMEPRKEEAEQEKSLNKKVGSAQTPQ